MATMYPHKLHYASESEKAIYGLLKSKLDREYHVWFDRDTKELTSHFIILTPRAKIISIVLINGTPMAILDYTEDFIEFEKADDETRSKLTISFETHPYSEQMLSVKSKLKTNPYFSQLVKKIEFTNLFVFTAINTHDYNNMVVNGKTMDSVMEKEANILKDQIDQWIMADEIESFIDPEKNRTNMELLNTEELAFVKQTIDPFIKIKEYIEFVPNNSELPKQQYVHIDYATNVLFQGAIGTGKTTLLIERINYLGNLRDDLRILIIAGNSTKIDMLESQRKEFEVKIKTVRIMGVDGLKDEFNNSSYDYILVLDGQNLQIPNYKKIMKLLKNDGNVWIMSTGAQNIFGNDFDYENIGIDFDEIIILEQNYVNGKNVVQMAEHFFDLSEMNSLERSNSHYSPRIKSVSHEGLLPEVHQVNNTVEQMKFLQNYLIENASTMSQLGVLTLNDQMKVEVENWIRTNLMKESGKGKEKDVEIIVMTLSEAVGFVFDESIIVGMVKSDDYLGRKLIYASMMTARNKCIFLLDQSNKISEDILESYKRILNPSAEGLAFNQPVILRGIADTIKRLTQREKLINRESKQIELKLAELEARKEDLTNREMRAIVTEGPKDIEILKNQIEVKDKKIQSMKKEIDMLRAKNRKVKTRNLKALFESMHFEKERIMFLLKWTLILSVLIGGYLNYPTLNKRLKIEERVTRLYTFINETLDQGITGSEEVVNKTMQLEVVGDDEVEKVLIVFDQLLEVDEGKLPNGYYYDGFQMLFEKNESRTTVKLFGNFQANEDAKLIQFDKIIELESDSIVIEVADEGLYKHTDEGVIPISFLWDQDDLGVYFEIFE